MTNNDYNNAIENGISPQGSSSFIPPINQKNEDSKRMINMSENSNPGST